ncbi:MAG: hypothetical protein ACE5HX_04685 [bacterium]
MKRIFLTFYVYLLLVIPLNALAQTPDNSGKINQAQKREKSSENNFIGFEDKNQDGINDKFMDANGDGKNDLNGKAYRHKFEFSDKNKDKINDLWVDQDGDGVNDLSHKFKSKKFKDIHSNVVDVDEDGRNDITGIVYDKSKHQWKGEKWGFWNEKEGKLQGRFIDEDGDGIDDRVQNFKDFMAAHKHGARMRDRFIDEDGDGICDGRNDFIGRMGRMGHKKSQRGHNEGGGHH